MNKIMRDIRRDNKDKAMDQEVRERYRISRENLLQSFSSFSKAEKLKHMAELNELLLANMGK